MKRQVSLEEISDGRLYGPDDLVKIGTGGCAGCSDCCRMDPVIVLDPWDIFQIQKGTGQTFSDMLNVTVKLQVIDGLILPVLQMAGGVCPYLGADGRCRIHDFRPGICRMYPLGRSWEDGEFSYILQVGECAHCLGTKIKVKKWLGIPDLKTYEDFCVRWHTFLKRAEDLCDRSETGEKGQNRAGNAGSALREGSVRHSVCMAILRKCFLADYDAGEDFFSQFDRILTETARAVGFPGA